MPTRRPRRVLAALATDAAAAVAAATPALAAGGRSWRADPNPEPVTVLQSVFTASLTQALAAGSNLNRITGAANPVIEQFDSTAARGPAPRPDTNSGHRERRTAHGS